MDTWKSPLTLLFPVCKVKNKVYPMEELLPKWITQAGNQCHLPRGKVLTHVSCNRSLSNPSLPLRSHGENTGKARECLDLLTALGAEHLLVPMTSRAFICVPALSTPGLCTAHPQCLLRDLEWREAGKEGINTSNSPPSSQIPESLKQRSMLLTTLECTKC